MFPMSGTVGLEMLRQLRTIPEIHFNHTPVRPELNASDEGLCAAVLMTMVIQEELAAVVAWLSQRPLAAPCCNEARRNHLGRS